MHVQRLQQETGLAYDRSSLIDRVASRFYVDEPTVLVRNGLSTDLLCTASDLYRASRRQVLTEKIHDAMEYATAFTDVEELNALQYMAPSKDGVPNYYLTLGLYLYLADECSRKAPDKTFLSALREAKVSLDIDDVPDAQKFFERAKKALEIIGMNDEEHIAVLREWKENGTYTLNGEKHYSDDDAVHGVYAELARNICLRQKYLGMNLAISYALGNKRDVESLNTEAMFADARKAAQDSVITDKRITRGFDIREEQMLDRMFEAVKTLPAESKSSSKWTPARINSILNWLPDQALEMLDRERYICAYADAPVIESIYPKENPPGIKDAEEKDVRNNKGQWLQRYRTIFMSNGYRQRQGDIDADPRLKSGVVAQTLLHEIMHMAIAELPEAEKKELKEKVEAFSEALNKQKPNLPAYFDHYLRTIDTNTLTEVLDTKSRLYTNYSNKWEEVACNMYGLMHTEFCGEKGISAPQPFTQPPEGLESLPALSDSLNEVVAKALSSMRNKATPNWGVDRLLEKRLSLT